MTCVIPGGRRPGIQHGWIPRQKLRGMTAILLLGVVANARAVGLNQPAPTFSLLNSHHKKETLSMYKGDVVFINFWASWCGPCQEELPLLNQLAAEYKGKKVKVLAINVDESPADARKLLAKLGLSSSHLNILWDSKSKVVSAFDIKSMPSSFILDSRGVVRFIHTGFHDDDPSKWRDEISHLI